MFDDLVDGLNLALGLQVVLCGEVFPDTKLFTKNWKMGIVNPFPIISDDRVRDAESAYEGFYMKSIVLCFMILTSGSASIHLVK